MGHKYEWVEEPWIMKVSYYGRLMHDDLESVMEHCLKVVDKHPANFLIDITEVDGFDPNTMKSKSIIVFTRHPNTKWFAVVGLEMSVIKLGIAILGRFASIKVFNNTEAGLTFLREMVEHQKQDMAEPESI